jgi:excisionase family DNA binding protein
MPTSQTGLVADAFDALLDRLATRLVDAVIARLEQRLPLDWRPIQAPVEPPAAYDTAEAARLIGLSVRETKRRIATRELRSVKVGRLRRVPREAIGDFLEDRNGTADPTR